MAKNEKKTATITEKAKQKRNYIVNFQFSKTCTLMKPKENKNKIKDVCTLYEYEVRT